MPAWLNKWKTFVSRPLPQRLSAQDTTNYVQQQPTYDPQYYLTYWNGNQLPGWFMHTNNPIQEWMSVSTRQVLYSSSPYAAQRTQGSFNYNLSQQSSAQVQAVWSAAWKAQSAKVAAGR